MPASAGDQEALIERIRSSVPAILRELPIWLLHDAKKIPIYASGENRHGAMDSAEDRAQLVSFEKAAAALPKIFRATGLGVALGEVPGEEFRLCGIDLDHCYDEEQRLAERAEQILLAANSYAEKSPSGRGLHILGIGELGTFKTAGAEVYSGARYFTMTGHRINGAHLGDATDAAELVRRLFGAAPQAPPRAGSGTKQAPGSRNNTLTSLAGAMRRAGFSSNAISDALHKENYERYEPPLPAQEVNGICDRAEKWERGEVQAAIGAATGSAPGGAEAPPVPEQPPIDWAALTGSPPARQWIIPHWIPAGHVTLLAGRGGVGKTLLAQHIGTALALGREYLEPLEACKVLMWACEDDADELWRRQIGICSYLQAPLSELAGNFFLHSYAGRDVTLMAPIFGKLESAPMLAELARQVALYAPRIVILDNIARLYGGNENERHAVTTFCALVQGACAPAAVLLLGHPSRQPGSEFSGSSAWEGAARARLYLNDRLPDSKPDDDEDALPVDERIRYLARRKANYSALDIRKFSICDGVMIPDAAEPIGSHTVSGEFAKEIMRKAIRALAALDLYGCASTASPNYLPKMIAQYGQLDRISIGQCAAIMRAMMMAGELLSREVGKYANRTPRFGLVLK